MEQEPLQIENDSLQNYFENTIIPQLYVDAELVLRKFTPPAMKQFSLSNADIGKNMVDVVDNIRYPTIIENIEEVINTGIILEKEVQTTDKRWFQMNILPYIIRKENKTDGVIITFVDITTRIKILKELEKTNTDHNAFIYSVSHDIKQPLTILNLMSEVLTKSFNDRDIKTFETGIKTLNRAIENINIIIHELTAHATTTTDLSREHERLSIENIYEDVKLLLRDEMYNNDIAIKTDFETSEIQFSRKNLRSILFNLLINSIKYKSLNNTSIIEIKTYKDGDYIVLSVQDNGTGIDSKYHETIFEKNIRLSNISGGTGMGLYIVKTMLENNGGKINVESSIGEGAKFILYFKNVFDHKS